MPSKIHFDFFGFSFLFVGTVFTLDGEIACRPVLQIYWNNTEATKPKSCIFYSEVKIDCITVNTMPVKTFIDDLIQRLFDALLASLRKAITADVTTIDSFVSEAIETLSTRPQTVEEIGEASVKHAEFAKRKKEVFVAMICVVSIVAFYRSE